MGAYDNVDSCFLPQYIFRIFIPEEAVIPIGVDYLRILGFSQMFMCMEIMTSGHFPAWADNPSRCGRRCPHIHANPTCPCAFSHGSGP